MKRTLYLYTPACRDRVGKALDLVTGAASLLGFVTAVTFFVSL